MSDLYAYIWITLGVIIAVILPVMMAYLRKEFPSTQLRVSRGIPPWLKRYVLLGVISLVVGLVCLAIWKNENPANTLTWYAALVVGFAWESAVEKFIRPIPQAQQPMRINSAAA